jgi:hypothetical protein
MIRFNVTIQTVNGQIFEAGSRVERATVPTAQLKDWLKRGFATEEADEEAAPPEPPAE